MTIAEKLQELGIGRNEAKVYAALLAIGRTSVGQIVTKTSLHRMLVYEALERLQKMQLVSSVTQRNRKYFSASDPDVLGEHLQRKERMFQSLLPQLQALQTNADDRLEVKLLYGHSGFLSNLEATVLQAAKHDRVVRILGGGDAQSFYGFVGDGYDEYLSLVKRHRVTKHLLAPESASSGFKERFALEKGNQLRTLNTGLSSPTYTRITPEMVSIEIYAQEIIVIQIFNRSVAQGYRDSFDLLWKQAKPYSSVSLKKHGSRM